VKLVLSQAVGLAISTLVLMLPSQTIASIPAIQSRSTLNSIDVSPSSKALPAVGSIPYVSHSDLRRLQALVQRYSCLTLDGLTVLAPREQFAFVLNTCLERAQVSDDRSNRLSQADLEAFEHLQRSFAVDIAQVETQWSSIPSRPPIQQNDPDYVMLQSIVNLSFCTPTPPKLMQESLTQREFTIILNNCLNGINVAIAEGRADGIPPYLQTLHTLQENFRFELSLVRGRMDALEDHV
jgi:hypothetical protein